MNPLTQDQNNIPDDIEETRHNIKSTKGDEKVQQGTKPVSNQNETTRTPSDNSSKKMKRK